MAMTIEQLHGLTQQIATALTTPEVTDCLRAAVEARQKVPEQEAALNEAAKRIAVLEQRLTAAMAREEKLKEGAAARELETSKTNAELRAAVAQGQREHEATRRELATAQQQVATMREHPDVRRAERERLAAQLAALQRQHDALVDPEEIQLGPTEFVPHEADTVNISAGEPEAK